MSLWKQSQGQPQAAGLAEIESLLRTAISLDPEYADAYLQLGILYSSQRNYSDAISQYQQALKYKPDVAVIHYRLGQALARSGATARAQQEFAEFERLHAREVADTDRQTADIQQFLYTVRNPKGTARRQ
jgi:tetratricopeptide (TPR) repeat protein